MGIKIVPASWAFVQTKQSNTCKALKRGLVQNKLLVTIGIIIIINMVKQKKQLTERRVART